MTKMATDGDGACNTGKPRREEAKGWFLTLNNPTEFEKTHMAKMATEYCTKFRIQMEIGENGTPHLQGTLELKKKERLSAMKKWNNRAHWEVTKNSQAALAYCCKERTATGECWEKGYPKPVKTLSEDQLYDWEKEIIEIVKSEPDDRKIYWYWGDTNIGKTTFCKYLTIKYGAIALSGKCADMKNGIVEYMKTNGNTPVLILIPLPKTFNYDYISYDGIESVKDMYFYSGKYEGGMVCGNCPHVIIFANEPPDESKLASDRWVVRRL